MCDYCCNPTVFGAALPGYIVACSTSEQRHWHKGEYALMHDGHAVVVWSRPAPQVDPLFDKDDDAVNASKSRTFTRSMNAITVNTAWGSSLRYTDGMRGAHELYNALMCHGYVPGRDGIAEVWLAEKIARVLSLKAAASRRGRSRTSSHPSVARG